MSSPNRNPLIAPASPCVRNCCLDSQDVCLGCHRSLAEILAWGEATPLAKQEILDRCAQRHRQHLQQVCERMGRAFIPR